jgi:hypothetical protein
LKSLKSVSDNPGALVSEYLVLQGEGSAGDGSRWTEWSEWSPCSATCGHDHLAHAHDIAYMTSNNIAYKTTSRKCLDKNDNEISWRLGTGEYY